MKSLKQYTLLIAEDEPQALMELAEFFSAYFKSVSTAKDGQEAIKSFTQQPTDVVLFDISMPFINGLEAAEKIRKHHKETLMVLLTAHTQTEMILRATELNLSKYLVKPLDRAKAKQLLLKLAEQLSERYPHKTYLTDNLIYDDKNKLIISNGTPIKLTKNECILVEFMILNKNKTISSDDIVELLYEHDTKESNYYARVKTLVSTIKRKVPDFPIENQYGIGYRLQPNALQTTNNNH